MTDVTGTPKQNLQYYPYGGTRLEQTDLSLNGEHVKHRFTGHERDFAIGIYYAQQRYYDQRLARFISPDPVGPDLADPQSLNPYAYCRNNPVKYVDPTGEKPHAYIVVDVADDNNAIPYIRDSIKSRVGDFTLSESDTTTTDGVTTANPRSFSSKAELIAKIKADRETDKEPVEATIVAHGNSAYIDMGNGQTMPRKDRDPAKEVSGPEGAMQFGTAIKGAVSFINIAACMVAREDKGNETVQALSKAANVNVEASKIRRNGSPDAGVKSVGSGAIFLFRPNGNTSAIAGNVSMDYKVNSPGRPTTPILNNNRAGIASDNGNAQNRQGETRHKNTIERRNSQQ